MSEWRLLGVDSFCEIPATPEKPKRANDPQNEKKQRNVRRKREKSAKFWAPPSGLPTLPAPTFRAPPPSKRPLSGPQVFSGFGLGPPPSGPHPLASTLRAQQPSRPPLFLGSCPGLPHFFFGAIFFKFLLSLSLFFFCTFWDVFFF